MKVKLLSAWFGPKPEWYSKFVEQMKRFQLVDWECIPPSHIPISGQMEWMNTFAAAVLKVPCCKGVKSNAPCDFRPVYGDLFLDRYDGYDWWGWCDLDMLFGDL